METFISIVGSIASIFGAIWAFREATKAKRSAEKAELVCLELVDRRKLAEVSQIHSEIKRLLTVVARVGPTSTQLMVKGVDCADIARQVEVFVSSLLEHGSHFSDFFGDHATALRDALRPNITGLADARTFEDKKRYGMGIYYSIENFAPIVKQLVDAKRDQPPRT